MKRLSKNKDIADLQARYGAVHERIFKLTFVDDPFPFYFQAKDGKFHVNVDVDLKHDVELLMTTDTFLNIIECRAKRRNPETGEIETFPYTFYDAWAYGDLKARGERANNACKAFLPIFDELIGDLQVEVSRKDDS